MKDSTQGQVNPTFHLQDDDIPNHGAQKADVELGENDLKTEQVSSHSLLYAVEDVPPWHWSIFLAFQHYMTMFGGTISLPFILTPALCMEPDDPARSHVISTLIFVSGIITILQCYLGVRLPIIQGSTYAFLVPTFAILSLDRWKCPSPEIMANLTYSEKTEVWQLRMREIQGAITVAAIFQVAIGFFGIVGIILKYISPLTIATSIAMVGISLFQVAGNMAGKHWGISAPTILLVIVFSQHLRNVSLPVPFYHSEKGWSVKRINFFVLLPVLLAILIMWTVCAILTATDVLPPSSPARVDSKIRILTESPWIRFPYPGQWGLPTVSAAAVFGMLPGVLASAVESIGDYYACARLAGAKPPPIHAMNRGIGIEGIGCIIAGLWGSGNGTTSYSENIGAIGITKVGSRRVIIIAGCMMMFFGVLAKFGAFFITIPEPIIGGLFCIMFGIITATGISNAQFVDMNSSRNVLILGFSIFFSLVLSQWISSHRGAIYTGSDIVDQILTVLLSTSMFIGGLIAFVLDNTIPGTNDERGLTKWLALSENTDSIVADKTYDLPFITPWLRRHSWTSYIPFLPTYKPWTFVPKKKEANTDVVDGRSSVNLVSYQQ